MSTSDMSTPDTRTYITMGNLQIASELADFVREEALPGSQVQETAFWAGAEALLNELSPVVHAALTRRDELQRHLNGHEVRAMMHAPEEYADFLRALGYLEPEPKHFTISTANVDTEVALQAGPQLVVPLLNARFATNAANARWGSLYDALYGTDVIDESGGKARGDAYNEARGVAVILRGREFLDAHFPLATGLHADTHGYGVVDGQLSVRPNGQMTALADPAQFVGFRGEPETPSAILLVHHGLHVEIVIDREHPIGAIDRAGVADIVLESAVTSIMDLEDSVAAVDSADKVLGYRNWLGLIQRTLTAEVSKDGASLTRRLHEDRLYHGPHGQDVTLPGTSLLFIRQVGHHMFTDMVLGSDGQPVPEGIIDALVCGLASVHDLRGPAAGANSRAGSIYVVKPKLHGSAEVTLTCDIFSRVEEILGLAPLTIKLGIMDEERRTSANLKACIAAAADRVVFINTGFLDRTGDEIHTSMEIGPMVPKGAMKHRPWLNVYEARNVQIGLECGFRGRAQIGKGMWAAPDNLAEMLEVKIAHPQAGASCAWVPSPTAATLHALHYHDVDVDLRQRELETRYLEGYGGDTLGQLLTPPIVDPAGLSEEDRLRELDTNVQSTLGYVVRWIDAGVGCSKVPDITGTPLMEDRATCRISSQMVSNWLFHGVVGAEMVDESLARMAAVVDAQNAADPSYVPLAPACSGQAFLAARELLTQGASEPNGYTEPILHRHRLARKRELQSEGAGA
jgi:malate synthase